MSSSTSFETAIASVSTEKPKQLLDLPTELHLELARYLPLKEKMALRLTNHYLADTFPSINLLDLLEVEVTDVYINEGKLACSYCIRLRLQSKFGDDMKIGEYGCGGTKALERFCIDCGMSPPEGKNGYADKDVVIRNSSTYLTKYFCKGCKTLRYDLLNGDDCFLCRTNTIHRRLDEMQRHHEEQDVYWTLISGWH